MRVAFIRYCTALALSIASFSSFAAPGGPGDQTTPVENPCLGHLTRAADDIVFMQANEEEYLHEVEDAPVTYVSNNSPIINPAGCTRRVIEIRVPYTTSSGCDDCYPNAEIYVCAGYFSGSKLSEEVCRVPQSSTPEEMCKTFKHRVDLYKRPAGSTTYTLITSRTYKGFMMNGTCRVAHQTNPVILDSAELYANVTPPASGTDRYRVLSYPLYNGALVPTTVSVHYDHFRN